MKLTQPTCYNLNAQAQRRQDRPLERMVGCHWIVATPPVPTLVSRSNSSSDENTRFSGGQYVDFPLSTRTSYQSACSACCSDKPSTSATVSDETCTPLFRSIAKSDERLCRYSNFFSSCTEAPRLRSAVLRNSSAACDARKNSGIAVIFAGRPRASISKPSISRFALILKLTPFRRYATASGMSSVGTVDWLMTPNCNSTKPTKSHSARVPVAQLAALRLKSE